MEGANLDPIAPFVPPEIGLDTFGFPITINSTMQPNLGLRSSICVLLILSVSCQHSHHTTPAEAPSLSAAAVASEQGGQSSDPTAAHQHSGQLSFVEEAQIEALKTPFKGITTSGEIVQGLFQIQATGVSTEETRLAAQEFLASLSEEQRAKTLFPIDDDEWRRWSNVDNGLYARQGVSIKELGAAQKKRAFEFMQQALSAKGYRLSRNIMKTDQSIRELNDDNPIYDEELYYFTILGTPSETAPWGWQLDGHHLVINYFILGDQVVMTPVFMGAEPVVATAGKHEGNTLFQDEQNLGLRFMQSLSKAQQAKATLGKTKTSFNMKTDAFKDNVVVAYEGLLASELSTGQQDTLLGLARQYVSNMDAGHAAIKMADIKKHLDKTYFAWIGPVDDEAVFYYRIQSPVILIEFDHQESIAMPSLKGKGPTRQHIHTSVRTPNGNDYGKDLLRQHLEQHHGHDR